MRSLDRKLLRDLGAIRGQALAIALVIGAGVALFVLMLSSLHSLELTRDDYYRRNRFPDIFASLTRAPERAARALEAIPGVDRVRTRVVGQATVEIDDFDEPVTARLVSMPERHEPVLCDVVIRSGRYLEPGRTDEVLASEGFAESHGLGPGDGLTVILNGRKRALTIVGLALSPEFIYNVRPGELYPDERTYGVLWIKRDALDAALDLDGAFNDAVLTLTEGASEPAVLDAVDRILEPFGGLGALPRRLQSSHWYLQSELDQLRSLGAAIPVIFLGVAAFLLNVVLARIVAVQRDQIAVLKALGYSNRAVASHYLKWSLLVALLGAALGVALGARLGVGMTRLYAGFFQFPTLLYQLPHGVVLEALGIAVVAACVGALTAVRSAVRLAPAEAMRPAPPASYRQSWVERIGLGRHLSQPTRMIVRNMQRHPGRVAVSVGGIAAGGAMFILGSFSTGAVDLMLDLQFNVGQRFDAAVTFVRPTSSSARFDLERTPGVISVEPMRSVAVRLEHGPRSRQLAITGLPVDARLNRPVDLETGVITLPPDGLALTAKLAEILALEPGDDVVVQVLEGDRRTLVLPVSRLVDDLMGINAYMDLGALHRALREGPTLSGAYLELDPTRDVETYLALAAMPQVAGVSLTRRAFANIQEMMAQNIGTVQGINALFALVIAFGVVYNSARIALAERSRELATLRVIGFTRGEARYILLGELAVVTLLALPVAMLIGHGVTAGLVQAMASEVYRIPFVILPATYASAALVLVGAALISGWIVGRELDGLDLVAVLKTRE